jgi:hypothetical protein
MTDEEIIETLKKADALLEEYKKIIQPAADELAKRKSIAIYGKEDCYNGDLGCWEVGCNTVCLHIKDQNRGETWEEDRPLHDKAIDFDIMWSRKADEAGIKHVHISGHY